LQFRDIFRVSKAITAKRMKMDLQCQRQNCSPLNAHLVMYRLRWYCKAFRH